MFDNGRLDRSQAQHRAAYIRSCAAGVLEGDLQLLMRHDRESAQTLLEELSDLKQVARTGGALNPEGIVPGDNAACMAECLALVRDLIRYADNQQTLDKPLAAAGARAELLTELPLAWFTDVYALGASEAPAPAAKDGFPSPALAGRAADAAEGVESGPIVIDARLMGEPYYLPPPPTLADLSEVIGAADAARVHLILNSCVRHGDGSVEFTLPSAFSVLQAAEYLNQAAEAIRIRPVFARQHTAFWIETESNAELRTAPDRAYRFKIRDDSLGSPLERLQKDYGAPAPLGAVSLAEACTCLKSGFSESLFRIGDCSPMIIGASPYVALVTNLIEGVYVVGYGPAGENDVAFAQLLN